jgi:hypothetical protein
MKKVVFSGGSSNKSNFLMLNGSMPGQESIRLAKKGGEPYSLNAGFRRFSLAIPLPPRLFAEAKRRQLERTVPALFGFGACFLTRATRK